jgi:hypothetical protein
VSLGAGAEHPAIAVTTTPQANTPARPSKPAPAIRGP